MGYSQEDLELFDKTRKGQNICEVCGSKKQMYYGVWCPVCDKPKAENGRLNAIKCLRHLEAIGYAGIEDRLWREWCDMYGFHNDSFATIFAPDSTDTGTYINDMGTLWLAFGIEGDSVEFEFSW